MGIEPPNSLQAIVFAAMFSGVVSMPEETILMEFGVSKKNLVENFQMGTETALGRANFIRTTKLETLQAFVMYMVGRHSTFSCQDIDRSIQPIRHPTGVSLSSSLSYLCSISLSLESTGLTVSI